MSKYVPLKYLLMSSLSRSKTWFFVAPFGGLPKRWYPQTVCQNICLLNICCWYQKKYRPSLNRSKNGLLGPHLGWISGRLATKNLGWQNSVCSSTTLPKIRFRCFVVYVKKSVQDLARKKAKKTTKQTTRLIAAKSGLVAIILRHINVWNIFCPT